MVGGLETEETNRRRSLSLARLLAGRCCHRRCRDPTQLTPGERESWSGGETVGGKEQLWSYRKWMTREILSGPEKKSVLLSFMSIKLLSGGVLVCGAGSIWSTCTARCCSDRQRRSPGDLTSWLSCTAEGSQGHSVENNSARWQDNRILSDRTQESVHGDGGTVHFPPSRCEIWKKEQVKDKICSRSECCP